MTELLSNLETVGVGLLSWILWMNLWCAGILAAALLADRLFLHRIAPTWRVLLFAAVFIRLVLPISLQSPIGLAASSAVPVRISLSETPAIDTASHAVDSASVAAATQSRSPVHPLTAASLAVPAYLAGIGVLTTAWAIGAWRLRRIINEASVSDVVVESGRVQVLRHATAGPVLIGTLRPRLVIPADLEERAGTNGVAWVVRHESAHLARRDPVLAAMLHAAVIITWPIAAVWLAASRIRGLMEEACDDHALRGAAPADREDYGRTLIELATPRPLARLVPTLPFGAGLRARIRALACRSRWPRAVQCAVVAGLAGVLIACTGSRLDGPRQQQDEVVLVNAESDPFKGSLPIRITILRSWPKHPRLDYFLGQVDGEPEPDWSIDRILTREEFAEVLSSATAANPDAVLSRPRMEVIPGMKATVSVGVEERDGKPATGFTLDSTVTLVSIPAGSNQREYTMNVRFDRYGNEVAASTASVRGVKVPQGQTLAMLATGHIDGEMLLVCVTPGKDESTSTFSDDRNKPTAAVADTRPLIEFSTRIYRVDAPKDYGSPKGDAPRRNWSAYPGGSTMNAAEFAEYQQELRGRAGYSMLSAPRVWVYPEQEATIELNPEPEAPEAKQIIRVRGTPDGTLVKCTGSYTRIDSGMTTEGSWNRPKDLLPGGAMVWSIHDSQRGAWYTVTIQAVSHAPGSIKPQTATSLSPKDR